MGWFNGLYRKIIVGSWNSPQAAMTARGPGTRKAPGDDCLCGKGFICRRREVKLCRLFGYRTG